jgi:RimJ/RimL family protein N-acetyltransferase
MFLEIRNECADCLHDNRRFALSNALQWWKKNWKDSDCTNSGSHYYLAIFEPDVGMVGYVRIQEDYRNQTVTVGADIHKDHRLKGYATAAYHELFRRYFAEARWRRMQLEVLEFNASAIALYEKLGFVREGVRRQAVLRKSGSINSVMMSMTVSDYEKMYGERTGW